MHSNSTFKKVNHKPKASYKAEPETYGKGRKPEPTWKSNQRNSPKRNWNLGD